MKRDLINRLINVKHSPVIPGLVNRSQRIRLRIGTSRALLLTMAKEVERKFLIRSDAWRARVSRSVSIRQFYLAVGADRSMRIRIVDGVEALLTLKFGSNMPVRDEFEYPVALSEAREMQAFAVGTVIEKTRHFVPYAGYVYEVDVFEGALDGLVVAELETPDLVPEHALPGWLGREVTGDQRYSNAVLSLSARTQQTVVALAG